MRNKKECDFTVAVALNVASPIWASRKEMRAFFARVDGAAPLFSNC